MSASDLAAEPRLQPGGCLAVEQAEMDTLCQRFAVGRELPRYVPWLGCSLSLQRKKLSLVPAGSQAAAL